MKILISKDPASLVISEKGLTEDEVKYIENTSFERVEVKSVKGGYSVTGRKPFLYDFLYQVTMIYDVDLV